MDFWAQRCLEEAAEAQAQGGDPPKHALDHEMADTVMDFLFASQDASTSSLVWMICLMADHPAVLAKVCAPLGQEWGFLFPSQHAPLLLPALPPGMPRHALLLSPSTPKIPVWLSARMPSTLSHV